MTRVELTAGTGRENRGLTTAQLLGRNWPRETEIVLFCGTHILARKAGVEHATKLWIHRRLPRRRQDVIRASGRRTQIESLGAFLREREVKAEMDNLAPLLGFLRLKSMQPEPKTGKWRV